MVAPAGQAPPAIGATVNVDPGSPTAMTMIGAPLAVAVSLAPVGLGAMLVNARVTAFGSIVIGSGGNSAATNGAIEKISVPPWSWPLPLYGVLPSFAWTLSACRLTMIVASFGNS